MKLLTKLRVITTQDNTHLKLVYKHRRRLTTIQKKKLTKITKNLHHRHDAQILTFELIYKQN